MSRISRGELWSMVFAATVMILLGFLVMLTTPWPHGLWGAVLCFPGGWLATGAVVRLVLRRHR